MQKDPQGLQPLSQRRARSQLKFRLGELATPRAPSLAEVGRAPPGDAWHNHTTAFTPLPCRLAWGGLLVRLACGPLLLPGELLRSELERLWLQAGNGQG